MKPERRNEMKTNGTKLTLVALTMVVGLSMSPCFGSSFGLFGQGDRPGPDDRTYTPTPSPSVMRFGLGGEQLFPELYRERKSLAQAYKVHYRLHQQGKRNSVAQIVQRYRQIDGFLKSIPVTYVSLWNGRQLSDPQVARLMHNLRTNPGMRGKTYTIK